MQKQKQQAIALRSNGGEKQIGQCRQVHSAGTVTAVAASPATDASAVSEAREIDSAAFDSSFPSMALQQQQPGQVQSQAYSLQPDPPVSEFAPHQSSLSLSSSASSSAESALTPGALRLRHKNFERSPYGSACAIIGGALDGFVEQIYPKGSTHST